MADRVIYCHACGTKTIKTDPVWREPGEKHSFDSRDGKQVGDIYLKCPNWFRGGKHYYEWCDWAKR